MDNVEKHTSSSDEYNIFKGESEQSKAMDVISQKRREKILKEKGFRIFSKGKNEFDLIQELKTKSILTDKFPETLRNLEAEFHSLKINYSLKIKDLQNKIESQEKQKNIQIIRLIDLEDEKLDLKVRNKEENLKESSENIKRSEENVLNKEKLEEKAKILRELDAQYVKYTKELSELEVKIENSKNNEDENYYCCICLLYPSTHACLPCAHKKYCKTCIEQIFKCSICKTFIEAKIEIVE